MSTLVTLRTEGGDTLVIETDGDKATGGPERAGRVRDAIDDVGRTFEEQLRRTIGPVFRAVKSQIDENRPQEVQVSLGLKLSSEAGFVISKIAGEASFEVTLIWREASVSG